MYSFNIDSLITHLGVMSTIIQDFALIAGMSLIYLGLLKFKKYGEMRTYMSTQMTMATPLMLILGGSLLMFTPLLLGTAIDIFWGQVNPLSYTNNMPGEADKLLDAIIIFIRVLGIGVFIRGWIKLAKCGGESVAPGTRSKSLMHIFVGVLLMHFVGTEHLIMQALGFS